MIRAMFTAATGMEAQETRIDVIANNLANVNTTGFKKDQSHFQDLLYQTLKAPGGLTGHGGTTPGGIQVGNGVRLAGIYKAFSQGSLLQTGNQLDIAIEGRGFFRVRLPSGQLAYTRDGAFRTDRDGRIVTAAGDPLDPPLEVPPDTTRVTVSREGLVTAFRADEPEGVEIGRIELVDFPNPAGLESIGQNYYLQTESSGEAVTDYPGNNGIGTLSQGYLEQSNVKVVEEMIALINSQRAYEINSKVIQTADSMLQSATRIR
ncbi:MAG: flagellar basal-body rod protein FlgG [Deltaproteobacteria bacterium]|nr:MAG: flagellar basal-body rod protein FlgG [Deltaproteobacteria bacterium]